MEMTDQVTTYYVVYKTCFGKEMRLSFEASNLANTFAKELITLPLVNFAYVEFVEAQDAEHI